MKMQSLWSKRKQKGMAEEKEVCNPEISHLGMFDRRKHLPCGASSD